MLFIIVMFCLWIVFISWILIIATTEYERTAPGNTKSAEHYALSNMLWDINNRPTPRSGSSKTLDSAVISAVTDSTILGAVIGGDIVGAVLGDALDGDIWD